MEFAPILSLFIFVILAGFFLTLFLDERGAKESSKTKYIPHIGLELIFFSCVLFLAFLVFSREMHLEFTNTFWERFYPFTVLIVLFIVGIRKKGTWK